MAPQGTGDVSLTVEVLRASATETSYFQGTVDVPAKGSATLDVQSWPGGSAPIDATVQQAGQPDAPVTLTNGASQPAATCDTKILRCGDHGVCSDANGTPHCECNLGYSGAACDVAVTDCAQNPCQHGGTCRGGAGAFSCKCPSGYGGPTCAIEVCTSDATCGAGKFCDGGACHTCEQADANRCGDASAPAGCHVCSGATPMCQAGACVCAADASCGTGKYCGGGACNACSLTDANHCGKASSPAGCTVCPAETPECSSGACVCCADASCGLGHYCASGACAACSQTDASHCGSSGDPAGCQVCSGPTPMCFMGACIPAPPNSYAIATTSSGLSGLYSNNGCPGIPRYQNDCSAPFGFVWTDAGLSGHTLTSMSVDFELTSCATPGSTHTVTLNGTPIGTFGAPPAGGTCCTQQTVSFVPTTLAPYVIGGSNTLMITGPGSCESLDDLGGTLATVSVHYSP